MRRRYSVAPNGLDGRAIFALLPLAAMAEEVAGPVRSPITRHWQVWEDVELETLSVATGMSVDRLKREAANLAETYAYWPDQSGNGNHARVMTLSAKHQNRSSSAAMTASSSSRRMDPLRSLSQSSRSTSLARDPDLSDPAEGSEGDVASAAS